MPSPALFLHFLLPSRDTNKRFQLPRCRLCSAIWHVSNVELYKPSHRPTLLPSFLPNSPLPSRSPLRRAACPRSGDDLSPPLSVRSLKYLCWHTYTHTDTNTRDKRIRTSNLSSSRFWRRKAQGFFENLHNKLGDNYTVTLNWSICNVNIISNYKLKWHSFAFML